MPSIIIFCKTFLKGGAEKQALILSKLLTENKTNVILLSWCGEKIDSGHIDYIKTNSIKFIGLKGNPIKKLINLNSLIKKEKVSIILSYLTLANVIAGVTRLFHRNILTIGGIRTESFPSYKLIFERFIHNYLNDATVFNNYSAKNKFEKRGFNPEKIYVIHNAINVPPLHKKKNPKNSINVVSVSRFVGPKDFHTALSSFKQLKERNRDKKLKYYLVGYGPMEGEIRLLAAQLDLSDDVEIIVNPPNVSDILKSSDIYLSTSLYEGLSNSIMEAMAAGLPVVATNVGDNKYLIKDCFNGFLVPCRDINLITEKLEFLIKFEDTRITFGNNSHILISDTFSEEKLADNYLQLFSKLS